MLPSDRESSRDGERQHLRHQHSMSSDQGSLRALIPMWDSSDPERAPPPLPLNPQSPSLTSRAGTSAAIQSAHAALNERAQRENAAVVPSLAKRMSGDSSPDKALVKGGGTGAHRRMQSMQPGSVRDLSLMLEGGPGSPNPHTSPTRNHDRQQTPSSPTPMRSRDTSEARELGPGPSLTPVVRPTARRPPPQSILGENTPPQSSTMMALQSMTSHSSHRSAEPALSNITNGSMPTAAGKGAQSLEDISGQIITLTNIATSLQKEMSALSRRSRDNATDLLSLKEATTTRDEDIRKNLRDLMGSISETSSRISSGGGLYIDNKPHNTTPRMFQLPRIPSPNSFADSIERGSVSTPSLMGGSSSSADAAASLVLLEKIVREMGTKEGQDNLIDRLTQMSQKLSGMASSAKVDEILNLVRAQNLSAGAVTARDFAPGSQELSGPMTKRVEQLLRNGESRRSSAPAERGAELLNEDLINIIRSVKDSVAAGGGLTAEVKALVRELRGEVLGMGRELGKRLENVSRHDLEDSGPSKDEVSRVIDEGLEQMKDQLNHVLREHRRQSASSANSNKTLVDYQEIYNAMRAALRDSEASRDKMPDLSRDDVIEAVREAWENYKPEIEVQQLGLERDEVLACLQEGLQEYAPQSDRSVGATREEVFQAVVEGLKHFVPPQMDTSATLSRDEIIEAVRDCLEEFEFPVTASAVGNDVTRDDMTRAVQDGLASLSLGAAGGAAMSLATGDNSEVLSRLHDLMEYMKLEFRAVSDEAKENVAANGRDTEQLLDAIKDGLENLRASIEGYVDRSTGVESQEQFLEDLTKSVDEFKDDLHKLVSDATDASREQLTSELEKLREMVNSSMVPATPQAIGNTNQEVLEALQSGVNTLRQEFHRPRTETGEIIDAFHEGLKDLREAIDRVGNKPVDLTANDEILEALKSGLDSVKSDIETLRDSSSDKAVTALHNISPDNAIVPADMVKQDDIKNLEVLISGLRIKVEAMEPDTDSVHRDDLTRLEEMLSNVQQGVEEIKSREHPASAPKEQSAENASTAGTDAATRDDVVAIETILRNTKDRLDDLIDGEQAVRKDQIDAVETAVLESKESLNSITEKMESMPDKADVAAMGTLIAAITAGIEGMKEKTKSEEDEADKVSKTDIEAVETAVLEMKTTLDAMALTDLTTLSQKEDVTKIETTLTEAKGALDSHIEATAKALEDRQAELVGVGERVLEVKAFLEEFQETVKGKFEEDSNGIESVGKLLETMGEKIDKNENIGQDLKDLLETMKSEFENSRDVVAGAKLETDEKLLEAKDSLSTKIDEKIAEVIAKYDELQAGLDEKTAAGEARGIETAAAVADTKTVAEELRTLVDTLGSTVTDSLEKMEEASKTVFSKVEDLSTKTDDIHTVEKSEHQQTRESIQQAVSAVEGLQGEMKELQPQILEAVKDVLVLVEQHFEHSKSSATDIQDKLVEVKPTEQEMQKLLPAPEKYDDSHVREQLAALAGQRYDDSEVHEKLDRLAELKYDDTPVREKLETITEQTTTAAEAFSQLDKVHESVLKTASEISEFLASQTQRISDEQADREKVLQEANIELERKLAQQAQAEASIASLREEEERLRSSVLGLRTEQESLIRQKTRLTGDVSSLETALRLRKEELADMEHRAEGLERRILEGVMDHSRVLLMSKSAKNGDTMNRKRVKRSANPDVGVAKSSAARPGLNMALSAAKRSLAPSSQTGTPRRIVSLSQINNNISPGGVKRSQSTRSPAATSRALRKRSWGGDMVKGYNDLDDDKENNNTMMLRETVEEVDEPATPEPRGYHNEIPGDDTTALGSELTVSGEDDDTVSDAGTLRRSSRGTTIMTGRTSELYTESESGSYISYDDSASDWTESAVGVTPAEGNEVVVYGQ